MKCPVPETIEIHLEKIDPMIRETIVILNQKCYFTDFSCEGHYKDDDRALTYIAFRGNVDFPFIPRGMAVTRPNESIGRNRTSLVYIGSDFIEDGVNLGGKNEEMVNDIFRRWAHALPPNCSPENRNISVKIFYRDIKAPVILSREEKRIYAHNFTQSFLSRRREVVVKIHKLDDIMQGILLALNRKCYYTIGASGGDGGSLVAVSFIGRNVDLPRLPDGFIVMSRYNNVYHRFTTMLVGTGAHSKKIMKENLRNWANNLPSKCSRKNEKITVKMIFDEDTTIFLDRE